MYHKHCQRARKKFGEIFEIRENKLNRDLGGDTAADETAKCRKSANSTERMAQKYLCQHQFVFFVCFIGETTTCLKAYLQGAQDIELVNYERKNKRR